MATRRLTDLIESLKNKGMTEEQIQKAPKIRHIRARLRQANRRLSAIAKEEALVAEKAEIKARKMAAPKKHPGRIKKSQLDPSKRKAKRERKMIAEADEAAA